MAVCCPSRAVALLHYSCCHASVQFCTYMHVARLGHTAGTFDWYSSPLGSQVVPLRLQYQSNRSLARPRLLEAGSHRAAQHCTIGPATTVQRYT